MDGTAATRFGSAWSDGQWWQVDLGAPTTVGKVAIEWEAAYASTYKILTSIDGQSWTQRASVSLGSAVTKVTTFEPATARYVRILGVNRATQYGISFWEVHVYGGAAPPARPADPAAPAVPVPPPTPTPAASGASSPTPPAKTTPRPRRITKRSSLRDRAATKRSVRRCTAQARRRAGRALPKHRAACRLRAKRRAAARRN